MAVLRKIEDDTRTAAKLTELSGGVKQPKETKWFHFAQLAFSQLCYLMGSHGMRSMASRVSFELHRAARVLASLTRIIGRAARTARALANQMQPPEARLRVTQSGEAEAAPGNRNQEHHQIGRAQAGRGRGLRLDISPVLEHARYEPSR